MKKWLITILFISSIAAFSFRIQHDIPFNVPQNWPLPAYDFAQNPLSQEKILLGRKLFYEPLLSRNNSISCSSCHLPQTAFTHIDHDLSHGIDNRIGIRNSPALMNLAWSTAFMRDGAVHHLDVLALAPISNPNEMDEKIENVVAKLNEIPAYRLLFSAAFGDSIVTGQHTMQALSQFMLTLVSKDAKYDKVMRKEDGAAFTENEKRGYELFKANCGACHKEPLFTNNSFENNGLPADTTLNDTGREKITHRKEDAGKFKVPTLRNIEVTYPYMHDGRFRSLQMVLFHYTEGIHASENLSPLLKKKIILTENDKRDLISFLKTLTDETFLHNPANQYQP